MRPRLSAQLLLLAVACVRPRTEIVATIGSELSWGPGQQLQSVSVEIRTRDASGPQRSFRLFPVGLDSGRTPLPLVVGVLPDASRVQNDPTPVWIEVLGCSGSGCTRADALVSQRAIVQFVSEETLDLRLLLSTACVRNACDATQRCDPSSGTCVGARVAPPPVGTTPADAGTTPLGRDVVATDAAEVAVPEDAPVSEDASIVDVLDATVAPVDAPDAAPPGDAPSVADAPDAGTATLTLAGTFVAAGASGTSGTLTLRGVMTWHAAVRGTGGGMSLEGWAR